MARSVLSAEEWASLRSSALSGTSADFNEYAKRLLVRELTAIAASGDADAWEARILKSAVSRAHASAVGMLLKALTCEDELDGLRLEWYNVRCPPDEVGDVRERLLEAADALTALPERPFAPSALEAIKDAWSGLPPQLKDFLFAVIGWAGNRGLLEHWAFEPVLDAVLGLEARQAVRKEAEVGSSPAPPLRLIYRAFGPLLDLMPSPAPEATPEQVETMLQESEAKTDTAGETDEPEDEGDQTHDPVKPSRQASVCDRLKEAYACLRKTLRPPEKVKGGSWKRKGHITMSSLASMADVDHSTATYHYRTHDKAWYQEQESPSGRRAHPDWI